MHAYLLISSNFSSEEIKGLIPTPYEKEILFSVKTIDEVRALKKNFLFSPTEYTLVIITDVDQAKHEAQNALLKLLEEPPSERLSFLIVVKHEDALIPTVLSRLTTIRKPHHTTEVMKSFPDFVNKPMSHWYEPLSKITDREQAIQMLEMLIESAKLSAFQMDAAVNAIEALRKNGSVVLQLTQFLLTGD